MDAAGDSTADIAPDRTTSDATTRDASDATVDANTPDAVEDSGAAPDAIEATDAADVRDAVDATDAGDATVDAGRDSAATDASDASTLDSVATDAGADATDASTVDAPSDTPAEAAPDVLSDTGVANRAPVVSVVSAPSTATTGANVALSITATDPDGDPLTITWFQLAPAAPGTFTSTTAASTLWISPASRTSFDADFEVRVTDGRSAPVVRTARVSIVVARFATDVQPVFSAQCAGCHGGSGGLRLSAGSAYANLVNTLVSAPACGLVVRVTPGSTTASMLFRRISSSACGSRMPRSDPTYFDRNPGQLVAIESWILSGAPNN
ncbi:MAG: hypothetical protein JNK05_39955 [Myxococcales bacterium]|nr:hypothetical protein [Myxococcales bacterium]